MIKNIAKAMFINIIYNYIGMFSSSVLSLATLIFITRNLNLGQFGEYNLVLSTVVFFTLLFNFGLPSVMLRFIPEYIIKNDYRALRKIVRYALGVVLLLGLIVSIASGVIASLYPALINKFFISGYLFAVSIIGMLKSGMRVCEAAFSGFLKQRYKVTIETVSVFIRLILFVVSVKLGYGVFGIIISIGLVDVLLLVFYIFRIEYYIRNETQKLSEISLPRFVRYGVKEYLGKLLAFFWDNRIDAYIITYYLGSASTGIFYFAVNLASMLTEYMPASVMQSMSQAIFARQYVKNSSHSEIAYLFQLNNKLVFFTIMPVLICFVALSGILVGLFFNKYSDSIILFPAIAFFALFYVLHMAVRSVITALERSEVSLLSSIAILYKIPITIILTRKFGLQGTALALGTSMFLYFLIQLMLTKRHINIGYPWQSFFRMMVNSLAPGFIVLFLKPVIKDIFSLLIVVLLSVVAYLVASFINKPFSEYDRQILNKPFSKPLWNF